MRIKVVVRISGKTIKIKDSTLMLLKECKGCGSWSDAIDSLFGVIEAQKKIIKELKYGKKSNNKDIS